MAKKRPSIPGGRAETPAEAAALDAAGIGAEEPEETPAEESAPADETPATYYEVDLPLCLVGKRYIAAASPEDAYEQYKKLGGIRGSRYQPKIEKMPEGWAPIQAPPKE